MKFSYFLVHLIFEIWELETFNYAKSCYYNLGIMIFEACERRLISGCHLVSIDCRKYVCGHRLWFRFLFLQYYKCSHCVQEILRAMIDLQFITLNSITWTRGLCLGPVLSNNNVGDPDAPCKWRNPTSDVKRNGNMSPKFHILFNTRTSKILLRKPIL